MQDILIQLQQSIMVPERIPLAAAAMTFSVVAGFLIGPVFSSVNPPVYTVYGVMFGWLGDRLDKPMRARSMLQFRGLLLTLFALMMAYGLAYLLLDSHLPAWAEVLILSGFLTSGAVWHLMLRPQNLVLARSSRVDLNSTDEFGITRVSLGFAAQSFDKGLVAPVFWYLMLNWPGVLVHSVLAFLNWRYGKMGFSKGFGEVAQALEKLLGIVPSLLAGFLLCAAGGLTPTVSIIKTVSLWWSMRGKAPYEQGGLSVSALAWPLNIVIGGPVVDITASSLPKAWVGPQGASAQVDRGHIRRALYLSVCAHLLFILILACAYLLGMSSFWHIIP